VPLPTYLPSNPLHFLPTQQVPLPTYLPSNRLHFLPTQQVPLPTYLPTYLVTAYISYLLTYYATFPI
jgi:hypothetical protein